MSPTKKDLSDSKKSLIPGIEPGLSNDHATRSGRRPASPAERLEIKPPCRRSLRFQMAPRRFLIAWPNSLLRSHGNFTQRREIGVGICPIPRPKNSNSIEPPPVSPGNMNLTLAFRQLHTASPTTRSVTCCVRPTLVAMPTTFTMAAQTVELNLSGSHARKLLCPSIKHLRRPYRDRRWPERL